jgi:hypothetical protein
MIKKAVTIPTTPSFDGINFLIVGLIVIVFSVIQTVYVPQWMKENEADHMEVVADQFSQLKFALDTHCQFKDQNNPLTTSITLGNKEMPILTSSRSYGSIEILPNNFMINVSYNDGSPQFNNTPLNILKYSSSNSYFLDQEYIFEAGAVLLSQYQGDTMIIKPSFNANKEENRKFNISINLVNILPIGDGNSISGYGVYPIKTQYISTNELNMYRISDFSIKTDFPNSWEIFLNNSLKQAGLNYSGTGNVADPCVYKIISEGDQIKVVFLNEIIVNVNIKVIEIGAQLSSGWIDTTKTK